MTKNTKMNTWLVIETILVFFLLGLTAIFIQREIESSFIKWPLYFLVLLFQGFWFYRFYIAGHEASHHKLFTSSLLANNLFGTILLLPLMTPINIFREIHMFHHGFNRKDNHTSVLDTFTTKKLTPLKKLYFNFLWYFNVFFGGFFIHSLVSVFLFLFMPPSIARKISPAFNKWTFKDQIKAILLFALGVSLHLGIFYFFGKEVYLLTLGYPLLAFAWILSLFVYIYHYDTTVGSQVRYNVRYMEHIPFLSWVLMNFNEHATHHQLPNLSWYELPEKREYIPEEFAVKNQRTTNIFMAVLAQLKGPRIIEEAND